MTANLITFTSDFGYGHGYVATCELVMARLAPSVRVVHLSHDIAPGHVERGAELLERILPFAPVGVHLAVIDPGVGTGRRPLCLVTGRGDYLVGPDNGLLLPAAVRLGGLTGAWSLVSGRTRRLAQMEGELSSTFHARDLFAPAAALLATDQPVAALGDAVEIDSVTALPPSAAPLEDGVLWAEVTEVDRFGNIQLGVGFEELRRDPAFQETGIVSIRVAGGRASRRARRVTTYADLESGEIGLLEDSWGRAALVCNRLPAASVLKVAEGSSVAIAPHTESPEVAI